jgi:hypothetical protein
MKRVFKHVIRKKKKEEYAQNDLSICNIETRNTAVRPSVHTGFKRDHLKIDHRTWY